MTKTSGPFSMGDRLRSIGYALHGLGFAFRTQHNFRIQIVAALACVGLGLIWRISAEDWRWAILAIAMVLTAELVNTAFEHLCDVVQPELHASVKAAKDVAAGAVLVTSIAAAAIGTMVFWPYVAVQIWAPLR